MDSSLGFDRTLRDFASEPSGATVPEPLDDAPRVASRAVHRCSTCEREFPSTYLVCPRDATPLGIASVTQDPLIGAVLGGTYRLLRTIGRGGMGRLYEAEHTRLVRRFAVKILHESHADKRDAVRRFEREADALARIRSDFVLDVVDVLRTPDGRTAIVTALLEGEDLQRRLDRKPRLPPRDAIAIARQICRGLAAAHAAGVVHRDLKPSNLFLTAAPDGRLALKILDFGVAKLAHDDEATRTGVVLGTPAYMAPEQARGSAHADPRSDVYAIGAVLYRMVTGEMPYDRGDAASTLGALLIEPPPAPRSIAKDIPVALETTIQRAMAREPNERPSSALELDGALAALETSLATKAEPAPVDQLDSGLIPVGAIERAQRLERDAKHARPLALVAMTVASVASGAAMAATVDASLAGFEPVAPALVQALSIVGAAATSIACALSLARWLRPRWTSAPSVRLAVEKLGAATAVALAVVGMVALVVLAMGAITGEVAAVRHDLVVATIVAALGASMWPLREKR